MKEFLETRIKSKIGKIVLSDGSVIGEHDGLPFYTIGQRVGIKCHAEESKHLPFINEYKGNKKILRSAQDDNKPFFVISKDLKNNILIVGHEDDPFLYKKEIEIGEINWIGGQEPKFPLKCEVRLRHRQVLQRAVVRLQTTDYRLQPNQAVVRRPLTVVFHNPQRAVTPGQFAVFYSVRRSSRGAKEGKKGECLGGGVIL